MKGEEHIDYVEIVVECWEREGLSHSMDTNKMATAPHT